MDKLVGYLLGHITVEDTRHHVKNDLVCFRLHPLLGLLLGEFGRVGQCRPELSFGMIAHLYCEMSHAPVYKFFCFLTFHSSVMFWTKSSFVAHLSGSNAQAPVS